MKEKIRKAIIPAAGLGTRFLPATKAMPKEMFPVINKPVIQYVVEEAVASGIEDIIIVTGRHKRNIEDHFDNPFELEYHLSESGKDEQLEEIRRISSLANFIYVRQKGAYGNATPVINARRLIGDEPFAVLYGDDFFISRPPRLKQMIDAYNYYKGPILCCIESKKEEDTKRYAFIKGDKVSENIIQVDELIEKPGPGRAPSNIASVSGYVLTPDIFEVLDHLKPGKGGEYYLPDAIAELGKKRSIFGCVIQNGSYYDTGNPFAYLKANIDIGLKDPELGAELKAYLKTCIKS